MALDMAKYRLIFLEEGGDHLEEIGRALYDINRKFVTPRWLLRGLLSKDRYKRDMYKWWLKVALGVSVDALKRRVNPIKDESFTHLVKPDWYDL